MDSEQKEEKMKRESGVRLIDRKTLGEMHPALRNRWRVDFLIRTRRIPVVKIGRLVFFEEKQIEAWIRGNSLKMGEEE